MLFLSHNSDSNYLQMGMTFSLLLVTNLLFLSFSLLSYGFSNFLAICQKSTALSDRHSLFSWHDLAQWFSIGVA